MSRKSVTFHVCFADRKATDFLERACSQCWLVAQLAPWELNPPFPPCSQSIDLEKVRCQKCGYRQGAVVEHLSGLTRPCGLLSPLRIGMTILPIFEAARCAGPASRSSCPQRWKSCLLAISNMKRAISPTLLILGATPLRRQPKARIPSLPSLQSCGSARLP